MTKIKEAIEDLEIAKDSIGNLDGCTSIMNLTVRRIDQALTKLRTEQPPAGKFRERVKSLVPAFLPDSYEGMKLLCAILTDMLTDACDIIDQKDKLLFAYESVRAPKRQASEFTNKLRKFVKMYENEIPRRAEITFLEEACDILEKIQ